MSVDCKGVANSLNAYPLAMTSKSLIKDQVYLNDFEFLC